MVDTYTPVLRNDENERTVIQHFGGFANFDESSQRALNLEPIIEISGDSDLDHLGPFQDASDRVFVDLPAYQTRRDTDLGNAVEATIESYGGRAAFFLQNADRISYPVISGSVERPVDYDLHQHLHDDLQGTYSTITHRLMIRMFGPLNEGQRESLEELSESMRRSDRVVFDVVDDRQDEELQDDLHGDLQFLTETFSTYEKTVLNIFNAFNGQPENRSPQVADALGIEGFGDFAINVRYPGGGGPTGTVRIRHYHPNHAFVEEFEGETYADASQELTSWDLWQTNHCDYCRDADRVERGDPSTWKRIRMGHYVTSVLQDQI